MSTRTKAGGPLFPKPWADAIKAYLVYEYRVEASRVSAIGYGGTKPIVEEQTDEDRRLNRRVEFEIKREF